MICDHCTTLQRLGVLHPSPSNTLWDPGSTIINHHVTQKVTVLLPTYKKERKKCRKKRNNNEGGRKGINMNKPRDRTRASACLLLPLARRRGIDLPDSVYCPVQTVSTRANIEYEQYVQNEEGRNT